MKINKLSFFVIIMLLPMLGFSQESKTESEEIIINEYLYSGGINVKMPKANDDKDINGKVFNEKSLLKFNHIDYSDLRPEEGELAAFAKKEWKNLKSDKDGFISIKNNTKSEDYQIQYFVSYIEANRWLKGKLSIESSDMMEVYLNGKSIGGIYSIDDEMGTFKKDLKLEKQNYTLLIKILTKVEKSKKIKFAATLKLDDAFTQDDLKISTNPEHYMDIAHVLEGPRVNSVKVSADGKYYLASYSELTSPGEK